MVNDLIIIFQVYVVLWGLQLLCWPVLFHFGTKLADRGWAMGRTLMSLTLALVVWFGASLKFPINTNQGVTATLILLGFIIWIFFKKSIKPAFTFLKHNFLILGTEELLFALGFVFYALTRGFQPDILGLEKFMDFGFIKSYLNSPTLPARDMWFAGATINYYSFGHFWASILTRIFGVVPEIAYNLCLAFIMASGLSLAFSVIINLIGEEKVSNIRALTGGLFGSLLVILGGNSHTIWSIIFKRNLASYWYADATRFIYNTIHEFPSYSFVVSDLHGHVLGLPIVLCFILLAVIWHRQERKSFIEVVLGILLGTMVMTNTWDSMIYGLFMVIYGLFSLVIKHKKFVDLVRSAVVIGVVAGITALPWMISFKSISNGVGAVTSASPIWQLLVLWTLHVVITIWALVLAAGKNRRCPLILAIGLTAITLLLIPEFVFVKDIYPNHPRANTMFKLTYQAFILMGLLFGWVFYQVTTHGHKLIRLVSTLGLFAIFGCLMIFPFLSFPSYYNSFKDYRGLDGFSFLRTRYPSDLKLIAFLERNRDNTNMIEAVGDSYTETDFISALSGVPTVVGWRVHEWLWRGGYDPVAARDEDVRRFYEEAPVADCESIVGKYNLGWIVVSAREREKYKSINEKKLKELGEVVWNNGDEYLIRIKQKTN